MRTFPWIVLFAASITFASDWPQWRGPNFNCVSAEKNLPDSLDPNTVLWKAPLPGPGQATPVVSVNRVYISGYNKEAKELLALCFDASTGKQLWQNTPATFDIMPKRNILASPSPVADKSGCVFLYSEGTLVKYDPDGKQLWKRNLVEEYGPFKMDWGYSSSPLLYDGLLYIQVLRNNEPQDGYTGTMLSYLLAVDPATGKTIFKADRPTDAKNDFNDAYNTPIPITISGKKQIIVYGGNYITGHDTAMGLALFRYKYMDMEMPWGRVTSTPVADEGILYCPFPLGEKMLACDLSKLTANEPPILWTLDGPVCDVPSPVVIDGYLYMITDNKKTMTCIDTKTGQKQWTGQMAKTDTYYASITAADGKLYTVNRKGVVTVVAADSKEFRVISMYDFAEDPVDSTFAIANGKLYLRTAENLYCFGRK